MIRLNSQLELQMGQIKKAALVVVIILKSIGNSKVIITLN